MLNLEVLEERAVPATYYWHGNPSGDKLFSNVANWYEASGGTVIPATSIPNAGTEILFNPAISNSDCIITSSQACASINFADRLGVEYTGKIKLEGTLNIWGSNSSVNTLLDRGTLESTSSSAILNIIGGTFSTDRPTFNDSTYNLKVYVNNSAEFKAIGNTTLLTSDFKVGYDVNDNPSAGTFTVDATYSVYHNTTSSSNLIHVSTSGIVNIDKSLTRTTIVNEGLLNLRGGSLGIKTGTHCTVDGTGSLVVADALSSYTINGDVAINNGSLIMGTSPYNYCNLTINGNLSLGNNSIVSMDVNASNSSGCDKIVADKVTIASGSTLKLWDSGTPSMGPHAHDIISGIFNGVSGTFSTIIKNGYAWVVNYAPAFIRLTK